MGADHPVDPLLRLSENKAARNILRGLGLPLPLPTRLHRSEGALEHRPLEGMVCGVVSAGPARDLLAKTLAAAGAAVELGPVEVGAFRQSAEAWGRPLRTCLSGPFGALVLDASGLSRVADLSQLHAHLQPHLGGLARSGRVLVIGNLSPSSPEAVAVQAALPGFVRSLAKELGGKGITTNLLLVAPDAWERAEAPLRWLLSRRSAFVTGQVWSVDTQCSGEVSRRWTRGLDGRLVLVTGAARGIGAATAARLAQEGARVLLLDRPEDRGLLDQVAHEVGGMALALDLLAPETPERVRERAEALGGLDGVVHNAGITRDRTLAKADLERWKQVLDVNLEGLLGLADALEPALRPGARLVVLSSVAGIAGNMGQTSYAASKSALIGWVAAEAPRLAPRGISINAIAPGFIETRLTAAIPLAVREPARRLSALSQGGLPGDVAEAITFLQSPDSLGITGRTLRVCGGSFVGA